jgi:peptide/nickel transport system permease protein
MMKRTTSLNVLQSLPLSKAVRRPSNSLFLLLMLFVSLALAITLFSDANGRLADGFLPPFTRGSDDRVYLAGTDGFGRDMTALVARAVLVSFATAVSAVALGAFAGLLLGLIAGLSPGALRSVVFTLADTLQSIPATILAILLSGLSQALLSESGGFWMVQGIVVSAIGVAMVAEFIRPVATLSDRASHADFYDSAALLGVPAYRSMQVFAVPSVLPHCTALAANGLASAIAIEASLSFLGIGHTQDLPGLGYLVREGSVFFYSGQWWIALFPLLVLIVQIGLVQSGASLIQRRFAVLARTNEAVA